MIWAPYDSAISNVASVDPESTMMYSSPGFKITPSRTFFSVRAELNVRITTEIVSGEFTGEFYNKYPMRFNTILFDCNNPQSFNENIRPF